MRKKINMMPLLLLGLLALSTPALCESNTLGIHNASEFIDFVKSVNGGNDYEDYTVFLEATIDLAGHEGALEPIGKSHSTPFSGVFDGQGYAIGHFVINTTGRYAGLFGYSKGATIKNIILSMTDVMNIVGPVDELAQLHAGGIIGRCEILSKPCLIENNVNLANVTFTGAASS